MDISNVIKALGGSSAAARIFSVLPSAVSNWKALGRFPERLHLRIYRECQARGIDYDPDTIAIALPALTGGTRSSPSAASDDLRVAPVPDGHRAAPVGVSRSTP